MNTRQPLSVLAISGSLRRDSFNRRALQLAKRLAIEAGANVDELDLKTLDLPIYDQDIQDAGLPESVQKLKVAVEAADVIILASPEYNYSISAALKNALDWGSRKGNSWAGKTVITLGASDGQYGTVRGQLHLRQVLIDLNMLFLPQPMVMIKNAEEAFTPEGDLVDQKNMVKLKTLIEKTLAITPAFQAITPTKRDA